MGNFGRLCQVRERKGSEMEVKGVSGSGFELFFKFTKIILKDKKVK